MDRVLRRSLDVSESASVDETVKPAPPPEKDSTSQGVEAPALHLNEEFENGKPQVILADDVKDKVSFSLLVLTWFRRSHRFQ